MTADEIAICANCIDDEHLSAIVLDEGAPRRCSLCGNSKTAAFTVGDLGKLLEPLLRERLSLGGEVRVFHGIDDEKGGYEQQGDPLDYFVAEALGQDFDFLDDIVAAVIAAEDVWPPDGEEAFFEDYYNYVPRSVFVYEMLDEWQMVQDELRSSRRFFSSAAKSFFASLFANIDTLLSPVVDIETAVVSLSEDRISPSPDAGDDEDNKVVRLLAEGTEIFRARTCNSEGALEKMVENPYDNVGPPPSEKARAGRMNAKGIVVLYGALDIDTAIAEMRPPLGGDTITIGLRANRPLRVLDFKRLEDAYSLEALSYFQPDFDYQLGKHAFLQRLHGLISRPVLPGKEDEYLITQTMAEYLSHVHESPFDGILFDSVQRKGGTNIVVFSSADGEFPVSYVDESVRAFRTDVVQYGHSERRLPGPDASDRIVAFDRLDDNF